MTNELSVKRSIVKYKNGVLKQVEDEIVTEVPLTIYVNNEEFVTIVCSPENYKEMILGFLASEGVIHFMKDIKNISIDENRGFAYVQLREKTIENHEYFFKRFIGSCCGKGRQFYFQNDVRTVKTAMTKMTITAKQCIRLMKKLQEGSDVFKSTGGVHNAALCNTDTIVVNRADIGRHNALDKIYGYCFMNGISVRDKVLVFSGRLSSEIVTKAAKIGVSIILSKSAPTDLAIRIAKELNITAIGFIREDDFNIYSHAQRVMIE